MDEPQPFHQDPQNRVHRDTRVSVVDPRGWARTLQIATTSRESPTSFHSSMAISRSSAYESAIPGIIRQPLKNRAQHFSAQRDDTDESGVLTRVRFFSAIALFVTHGPFQGGREGRPKSDSRPTAASRRGRAA
jgi:hypothetical protein